MFFLHYITPLDTSKEGNLVKISKVTLIGPITEGHITAQVSPTPHSQCHFKDKEMGCHTL